MSDVTMSLNTRGDVRVDHLIIARMIEGKGARVLDVGCGDGRLLELLAEQHGIDGRGIEISREGVNASVARGLAVVQGDADTDLAFYPDDSFDYVILSQTIQATRDPKKVLEHMLRIGRHAVVSFPNFGHWAIRAQLALKGKMPETDNLPYRWYDTPNIHFCTLRDFVELTRELDAPVVRAVALNSAGREVGVRAPWWFWNLFGEQAVFLLRRGH
jgi:methionine biosynthesis protein MetW